MVEIKRKSSEDSRESGLRLIEPGYGRYRPKLQNREERETTLAELLLELLDPKQQSKPQTER